MDWLKVKIGGTSYVWWNQISGLWWPATKIGLTCWMYDKRQLKQSPTKCRDVVFKNNVMGLATSRMICLQKNNKSDERLLFLYPVEWTNPEDQNTTRASRRVASRRCGSPHCRSVEKKTEKSRQHAIFSIQIITKFAQKWRNWGNKSPFFDFPKAPPSQAVANDSGFQWLPGWGRLAWHFDSEVVIHLCLGELTMATVDVCG